MRSFSVRQIAASYKPRMKLVLSSQAGLSEEEQKAAYQKTEDATRYCKCGKIALYRVQLDGYCKEHHQEAVERRKKYCVPHIEALAQFIDTSTRSRDRYHQRRRRAGKTIKFGS